MRYFINLCLFLFVTTVCNAQFGHQSSTDKQVSQKMQRLNENNIDEMVCYTVECVGTLRILDGTTCKPINVKYLVWDDNGTPFIQRFDDCKLFKAAPTDGLTLKLIKTEFAKIKRSEIKPPEFTVTKNGKKVTYMLGVDHTCVNQLYIYKGSETLTKSLDDFWLETKYDEEYVKGMKIRRLNRNYKTNKASVLVKLLGVMKAEVKAYEAKLQL